MARTQKNRLMGSGVVREKAGALIKQSWQSQANLGFFLALLVAVALAVFAAVAALRFALRSGRVDFERLSAALSAYLLAGHFFGIAYFQVEQLRPGSLAIAGVAAHPDQLDLQTSIYFSFVTLATLGYGDISPLTPTARGLAVTEAILGQLYLAVLVARLVGVAAPREESG